MKMQFIKINRSCTFQHKFNPLNPSLLHPPHLLFNPPLSSSLPSFLHPSPLFFIPLPPPTYTSATHQPTPHTTPLFFIPLPSCSTPLSSLPLPHTHLLLTSPPPTQPLSSSSPSPPVQSPSLPSPSHIHICYSPAQPLPVSEGSMRSSVMEPDKPDWEALNTDLSM